MILVAFVPLLYPALPPLVDLPGHMGRYRVQLDLAYSPDLQRYYDFEWHLIGNLGVDLLVIPLSKVFGLELAVKLVVMAIPPLTVAGFLWVAREVHNRLPPTAAFALPFALGHPFLFGFVNFTLSMALAFLAFGLWLRLGRLNRTTLRAVLFVPISFLLFVTHAFGWGTLGLLAFSAEAVRQHDKGIGWWKAGLRAGLHASVMIGPAILMLAWRNSVQQGMTADWFNFFTKTAYLLMSMRDRWKWLDFASVAAILILLMEARRRPELTFSRNLAFSAAVLLAGYLVLPRIVFGSAYADMRLAPYMLAAAVLAIRFRGEMQLPVARILAWLGLGYYLMRVAVTTVSLALAANDQSAKLSALDHIPRGARVVNIVWSDCDDAWTLPRNSHLGAMAIVRRHAFSNDQWAIEGSNLLSVEFEEAGQFRSDPSQMVRPRRCSSPDDLLQVNDALKAIPRQAFDYLWIMDLPAYDPKLVEGMRPVWQGQGSTLFEIVRDAPARPPGTHPPEREPGR
jgi:hypothetical protein